MPDWKTIRHMLGLTLLYLLVIGLSRRYITFDAFMKFLGYKKTWGTWYGSYYVIDG